MKHAAAIFRRLADIQEYLDELEPLRHKTFEEYERDYVLRHAVERLIELIVEAGLDINSLILLDAQQRPPRTYRASYLRLGTLGIVPQEMAEELAGLVGLRNRLAHEYEEIQDKEVFRKMPIVYRLFTDYVAHVAGYVEAQRKEKRRGEQEAAV